MLHYENYIHRQDRFGLCGDFSQQQCFDLTPILICGHFTVYEGLSCL